MQGPDSVIRGLLTVPPKCTPQRPAHDRHASAPVACSRAVWARAIADCGLITMAVVVAEGGPRDAAVVSGGGDRDSHG